MLFQRQIPSLSFKQWLKNDRENSRLLLFAAIATLIQFAVLKILYPYPNFMTPESNSYLEAAFSNQSINIYGIGYSKFLRFVSSFTSSHFVLILIQYLLLQLSVLYFLFSIRYLLGPGKWTFRALLAGCVLNPMLLHVSNYISADAVFLALSLTWIAQLLWMLYESSLRLLIAHAIILALALMVQYNALYYPVISIAVLAFSPLSTRAKLTGIGLVLLLPGAFVWHTAQRYHTVSGTAQYPVIGGWQMAANALFIYAFEKPDPETMVPARLRPLHRAVNRYMDTVRHAKLMLVRDNEAVYFYLQQNKSPLKKYLAAQMRQDTLSSLFRKQAAIAPLYNTYGNYLIKKHPKAYLQYYVWPNLLKYYSPPTRFMGYYNQLRDTVAPIVVTWFGWKSNKLPTFFEDKEIKISAWFTSVAAFVNLLFVMSFLAFVYQGGFRKSMRYVKRALWCMLSVWLANLLFGILSVPIELRYQLFPLLITFTFGLLLIAFMVQESRAMPKVAPQEGQQPVSRPQQLPI